MRPASIPALVFVCSLVLVGFTFLPSHTTAPLTSSHQGEGPLLFAYRFPAPAGVDRIAWWAWNPTRRAVWMASPEEGWAEVESNAILWTAQLDPMPEKLWQQLGGQVPIPGTVQIAARGVECGTFIADLPQEVPSAPTPGAGEATANRTTPASRVPLQVRCGWFENPITQRPSTFAAYQQAIANQGTAFSNAIASEPSAPVISAGDALPGTGDRL